MIGRNFANHKAGPAGTWAMYRRRTAGNSRNTTVEEKKEKESEEKGRGGKEQSKLKRCDSVAKGALYAAANSID